MVDKKQNSVRINAGEWRSRALKFPDVAGLRPTPDRVRQTVFNWLGQDLTGKTGLDLFAGTGVMGFEALSRRAKSVVLVENSRIAYQALMHNKQLLKAESVQVLNTDAMQFLSENTQRFDVIFCDPPYNKAWMEQLLPLLATHLSENGLLYVEAEYALVSDDRWVVSKSGKAGNVFYHILKSNETIA